MFYTTPFKFFCLSNYTNYLIYIFQTPMFREISPSVTVFCYYFPLLSNKWLKNGNKNFFGQLKLNTPIFKIVENSVETVEKRVYKLL